MRTACYCVKEKIKVVQCHPVIEVRYSVHLRNWYKYDYCYGSLFYSWVSFPAPAIVHCIPSSWMACNSLSFGWVVSKMKLLRCFPISHVTSKMRVLSPFHVSSCTHADRPAPSFLEVELVSGWSECLQSDFTEVGEPNFSTEGACCEYVLDVLFLLVT